MSGDSETAPTYYFSGITFNPDFYTTSSSTYLTKTTGKKYFLSYPTAQGEETISRLYTSQVSTSTPTETFNFLDSLTGNLYIGENATGTSGQIIQIGASALTTIKVGDLSVKANSLNNATNSANRSVKIGDLQTDAGADLDLGTHVNRLGDINIGTGNTGSTPTINIGATVGTGTVRAGAIINIGRMTTSAINIGHSTANVTISSSSGSIKTGTLSCSTQTASGLVTANNGITIPVGKSLTANGGITTSTIDSTSTLGITSSTAMTIGSTNSTLGISCGGALTLASTNQGLISIGTSGASAISIGASGYTTTMNNGITLGSGKGITLSSVSYTPANTQLGFAVQSTGAGWILNTTPTGLCSYSNILIGTYFVSITLPLQNFTIGTGQIVTTSITATLNGVVGTVGGIVSIPTYPITTNLTGAVNCQMGETFIGFLKSTDNTCRLETIVSVNTGNVTALPPTMNLIRIA